MSAPVIGEDGLARCPWAAGDPVNRAYHDSEWGQRVSGEAAHLERLTLEAFQSGLSWLTILNKREAFREVFAGFDADVVAAYDDADVERLMAEPRIVRNRRKIEAAIANARATVALRAQGGLEAFLWSFRPPTTPAPDRHRPDGDDVGGVAGAVQGPQEGRLRPRGPDHDVRPHGGRRDRGRPPRRLPPPGRQRRLGLSPDRRRQPSAAASAASAATRSQSPVARASAGVSHEPPTQPTLGSAR